MIRLTVGFLAGLLIGLLSGLIAAVLLVAESARREELRIAAGNDAMPEVEARHTRQEQFYNWEYSGVWPPATTVTVSATGKG